MDNKEFLYKGDFIIDEKNSFWKAIDLVFGKSKATHYSDNNGEFTFYWSDQKGTIKLPVALSAKAAADLAHEWLQAQPEENRKEPFDGDGSDGLGFKVYIKEPYNGWSYEICTIQPIWAWYHK